MLFDCNYDTSIAGTSVRGVMWDGTHYKKPIKFELNGDGFDTYTAELNIKGYNLEDTYLELYMYSGKVEYKLMDWHGNIKLLKGSFAD